jgi:hypothetical protein
MTSTCPLYLLIFFATFVSAGSWMDNPCNSFESHAVECVHEIESHKFHIFHDGKITYKTNEENRSITVPLPEGFSFETVRYGGLVEENVIFNIEITDFDAGASVIFSINLKNNTLIWKREIPAFNSSELLAENSSIYVGGIGYICKIDDKTGQIIWFHKGLYEPETQAYNGFQKPYVRGDTIVFPESKVPTAKYIGLREVVVNDRTGRITSK